VRTLGRLVRARAAPGVTAQRQPLHAIEEELHPPTRALVAAKGARTLSSYAGAAQSFIPWCSRERLEPLFYY
jgi:hypothetical protein